MSLFRRKRRVRIHFTNARESVDGIMTGIVGGHYVLQAPKLVQDTDSSYPLDGHIEIPKSNVLFVQVLGS